MKVGIVTIPDITNYGNRLQNYAVSFVLRKYFGCRATSLVAKKEKPFENGNYILWLKNFIARKLCLFPELAEKWFSCSLTRWANFYKWDRQYIRSRYFYEQESLPSNINHEYDMFFAGSDQIWNCQFRGMRYEDFFLKFAEKRKRAAISGSFGISKLPDDKIPIYKEGLSGFEHISVREDVGAEIVKELIGRQVPVLVDPVMLLDQEAWLSVAKKPRVDISKPYVLKYYLGDSKEAESLNCWAKENGFEVYELLNKQIPELYSAGPGEFISLIANASLVASDSFHCIAFSVIFRRPFVACVRQDSECNMMSRLDTLLKKFGLQDRWIHRINCEEYLDVEYSCADEIMEAEREKFMQYVQQVLDSVK